MGSQISDSGKVVAITLGSLLLGWASLYVLVQGNLKLAFGIHIVALCLDMLDGYFARKWKVESKLGAWLDSVSDVSLYLIFPWSVLSLLFQNINQGFGALFILAGLFRLVRFSSQGLDKTESKLYYKGMPVFYSLLVLTAVRVFTIPEFVTAILLVLLSCLMVSTVPFLKPNLRVMSTLLAVYCINLFV